MLPAVVVLAVTLRAGKPAVTGERVDVGLFAVSEKKPSFVVALVTVSAPLLLISMAPAPATFAEANGAIVVFCPVPVPAVAVRVKAVTLLVAPLASVIEPTAVSDT